MVAIIPELELLPPSWYWKLPVLEGNPSCRAMLNQ